MSDASFSVTIHAAGKLKVWLVHGNSIMLSADRFGIVHLLTLSGLSAAQMASIIETFGRWKDQPSEIITTLESVKEVDNV